MKYDKTWYDSLAKPDFQPPAWVFAPVWIFLYVLMSVAFILVLISPFKWTNLFAYLLFFTQLWVHLQWAPAFFEEHDLRKAFLICALLTLLVFITLLGFFHISRLAGLMFLPYFLWCVFASILNFEILELNEW
jgi:translocator protein